MRIYLAKIVRSFVVAWAAGAALTLPAAASLVGHWTFDEGGGTNISDSSGLGNNGVLINAKSTTWTNGFSGSALYFDGTTGSGATYVTIPDAVSLHLTNAMSFAVWIRCDDIYRDAPILDKEGAGQLCYWFGAYGATSDGSGTTYPGDFGVLLSTNGNQPWTLYNRNQGAIVQGVWVHVASTWDGTTVRHYLNGNLVSQGTAFSGLINVANGPLIIGANVPYNSTAFKGIVDDARLYNHALSSNEISALVGARPTAAGVPYATDFESGMGPEWEAPVLNSAETLGFTHFTGRFNNDPQVLTLTNLVVGQSYTLGFDFCEVDSWDGSSGSGPDYFNVSIGGQQLFHQTFTVFSSDPQTYPFPPDEGPFNMGFYPGWPDAIYRNIEIPFTASNPVTVFVFQGQLTEGVDNESWGLDNVSVNPTSALTNDFVRSSSLPPNHATNSDAIDSFTFSARSPLQAVSATNTANYSLVDAGADGILGTGDDVVHPLTASLPGTGGRSVTLTLPTAPLQPGLYRFQTTTGLLDTNLNSLPVFIRDFTIANPIVGQIEGTTSTVLANATPLPVTESPVGSGFLTAFAVGLFSNTSDVDYWSFDVEAGDVVTVRLESESQGVYPHLRLRNASDQDVAAYDGGNDGVAQLQNITISTPGTYFLRVWSNNNRSRYWMRLDQSRGIQLESESNDSQASANQLNFTFSPGLYQARVAGALPAADTAGDYYRIGTLNVGNSISVTALYPTGSVLTASQTLLSVQVDGNPVPLAASQNGIFNFTVISNGVHYLQVQSTNFNLRSQYQLSVSVVDGVPPVVTGTSLPAPGTTTTNIVDRFSLNFSKDLLAASVSNAASYELRGAGADGVLGTSDDTFYHVAVSSAGYTSGLTAGYTILDGPLQPGSYRLTVNTNLTDRVGNHMAASFVWNFTVANLPGYILENRSDDAGGLGTLLGAMSGTNGDGTFSIISTTGSGSNPQGIAAGQFNGDTNLDVVTANFSSGGVTVYTNNGAGVLLVSTNIGTGSGTVAVATGDFNGDGKADLAVANYYSGTVSILLGDGNGGFQLMTNLSGFSNPYNLAVADLNHDNKLDLIVPNSGNGTITVLLGNGDGTFQTFTNYATGNYPECVAVGDLNHDNIPDLAVVNCNSSTVTLLLGNGDGSFQILTNLATGASPRYVAIADVTGDGIPDLVTLQGGENSVSIFAGNGDGTFQPRRFFLDNTTGAYMFALADLNGDGAKDIVVAGYGNNTFNVLLNNGFGSYTNIYGYSLGGNPIGVVAGDFDGDGRPDLVFCHYYGNYVSVWTGNPVMTLTEDPPGSGLRTASGRGIRSNSSDVDYWRFTGNAGDQMILAVDNPGNPGASQLYFQVLQMDGSVLTSFYPDYTGWGQSGVLTLPYTGTYQVRVAANYDYQGEYRIRVTLARPPLQLENQGNTSLGSANTPSLTLTNAHLHASLAGYLSVGDGGDYFNLGNLLAGATATVGVREPAASGLGETLWIYNSSGVLLTNSAASVTKFTFTIPPGQGGVYYVRVTSSPGGFTSSAGTAVRFDGGSDYVDLGTWFNYQTFTISVWLDPGSSQNTYTDIIDDNHSSYNWVIEQNGGNVNQYGWDTADGGTGVLFNLAANTWQNLTITRDATNISSVYLNGVLVGSNVAPSQINYANPPSLSLARWVGGGGRGWNGAMDDLRIWNRALSPGEVAVNLTNSLTGAESGLAGWWRFNEGGGTNAFDSSPSNHTGLLINGPAWVQLASTNARPQGLQSQYVLSLDLTNTAPPVITGITLPTNNVVVSNIITSFTVGFNEDMDPRFNTLSRSIYRYGGHTYLLTDGSGSWSYAEGVAQSLGGHLVAINSAAENAWLNQTFSSAGELWIGLNLFGTNGNWSWSSGDPFNFSNWTGGEPNNGAGYETGVKFRTDGGWDDVVPWTTLRGIVEITNSTDTDNDGWVDAIDPYPTDPKNAFDLRAAGPDGMFDTADDIVYRVYTTGYSSGLSASFAIIDGPLQPGNYRFEVTTSLTDRFGNPLAAPYVQYFAVAPTGGFVGENRRTNGYSMTSLSTAPTNRPAGSLTLNSTLGVGVNPYFVAQGYFNADSNLDLVTANISSGGITVLTNDGNANFTVATNIATGNGPISVAVADLNGDGHPDLAVANYYSGTVSVLLGDGAAGFNLVTNLSGFNNPRNLVFQDINHDGVPDLVVPNSGGSTITVWLGNGNGTFTNAATYNVGSAPYTVAAGDLNGDGSPDLIVANYNSATLTVLTNNGSGLFTVLTNIATLSGVRYVTLGDVNGDGKLDAVTVNNNGYLSVFFGNGDGTFQPRTDYYIGSSDTYQVVLADLNQDGMLDALVPGYGVNRLITLLNNGDGTFGGQISYADSVGNPISLVLGDYNHDGLPDIVTANYQGNSISVWLGLQTQGLTSDPAGTGLRIVAARGNLADGSDLDYWTFSAQAGDQLVLACENPGNPGASILLYRFYYPDGSQWTSFTPDYYGRGQINLTVPASGTYTIRVEPYYQYYGEFRFRLTLARPPVQLESENNDSIANANAPTLAISAGAQTATVLGYIGNYDTSGDFYQLGNLAAGTVINLGIKRPASSGLLDALVIYNSSGGIVSNSMVGATNLVWTVPNGGDGSYYAQVFDAGPAVAQQFGGQDGNAIWFNGGSWVYFTNGIIPTSGDFTVEAWAYGEGAGANTYREIVSQGSGGNAFYLGFASDNNIRLGDGWQDTGIAFPFNGWHHLAAVKSSTNTLLFVDGVLTASRGSAIPNPAAADYLRFSRQYGGYGEYWYGNLDEVRIWNVARAASDIQANMSRRLAGTETGLVGYWRFDEGVGNSLFDATSGGNTGSFQGTPFWVSSTLAPGQPSSILSQYLLSIRLSGANPPTITSITLPAEGTTISNFVNSFSLTFSQDMNSPTVTTSTNYELRCAGPDNVFGTADDQVYTVVNSPSYGSGTNASYLISDGPLQPGLYRFTAYTNLEDRLLDPMPTNFIRTFTVANVPGFVLENRKHSSFAQAVSLSLAQSNRLDGSFTAGPALGSLSGPERLAAGWINGDTNLDLAVALWSSGSVGILLGNGDGSFTMKTNIPTGSGAWSLALGKFNADTNLDLAVANYYANTVSILLGDGTGSFQTLTNIPVGANPYHVVTGDFDRDGKTDLAIPNWGNGNVSVLLGNGDGTFRGPFNYNVGSNPDYIAVGDVNGDGIPDLVVADYSGDNVSLLLGNGDGSFAPAVGIAAGQNPRAVVLADLNGDGKLDLAVFNGGDNTVSVLFGNGDGSFQRRVNYYAGTSDGYELVAADLNGDGNLDLAVGGYNNNLVSILLNNGDGTFASPDSFGLGVHCVGLVAGDFNNDGRPDLAIGSDNGNAVYTFLGNDTESLASDSPDGSIRLAAGRGYVTSGDADYWSFSGKAGDRLEVATQNPGDPGGSALSFNIYYPNGNQWTSFVPDYYGRGQLDAVLPVTGTYYLRVAQYYGYLGEYRFRITLAKPPVQQESEDNNSVGQANTLTFTSNSGHETASVLGYESPRDGGTDYFALGNQPAGAVINLNYWQPNSSGLIGELAIYNASGTLMTNAPAGVTNLVYVVPAANAYYANIIAASNTADLFAVYVLNLDLANPTAPAITSVTLPPNGTTNTAILDRFTINFTEDLDPALNALSRPIQLYGGHAYTITDSGSTWFDAETQARAWGGHLATINDLLENAFALNAFSGYGNLWLGLSDEGQPGNYFWSSGSSLSYTNWSSGQPNDTSGRDYVALQSDGTWADFQGSANYRGLVEVSGVDSDGDGIPDTLDPYPYDPLNLIDLRAAGPDGVFDTADDQIYHLSHDTYTSGLSLNFYLTDGPLQPGYYRFTITSSLRDRYGNGLAAPYVTYFTVAGVPGYVDAGRTNTSFATATPLPLTEDPAGMLSGAGRGKLFNGSDVDYWSFTGTSNSLLTLSMEVPGNPGGTELHYQIFRPDGTRVVDYYPSYYGYGQTAPYLLTTTGTYYVAVTPYYGYYGEYHLRVTSLAPPLQAETEDNGSLANANPVSYTINTNTASASVAGYINGATDLDYFNLGTVSNGYTIYLRARQPASSPLAPAVSVYNAANSYQAEAAGGRANDGVAEVPITQTGTYYALVRSSVGAGGLDYQYLLDVEILPTGTVSFPNLQVTSITLPSGTIQSGQAITYSYTVQNVGTLATPVANWTDRAALSADTTLGNSDDLSLGFFPHTGVLNPGDSYSVTNTMVLPDGISGDYYIIVFTDSGDAVNEFIFGSEKITVSPATFHINLAPYPDLRVENLNVAGPDANSLFTITWNTANRGNATAPAGFYEHFQVRNLDSGALLANQDQPVTTSLAPGATLAHQASVTTTNPANYEVQVVTDAHNDIYEYDSLGHADAEANNTATTNFAIIAYYHVAVQSSPAGAGLLTGGGTYASGSPVTVTASPITNTLPYQFVNWTEGGAFQGATTNYSFLIAGDRSLTANFTLPSYQIAATINPAGAGAISGQGTYFYGTTNVLVASPNFGYRFTNWTENGSILVTTAAFTNLVTSNRLVVANFAEANTAHLVTTGTSPTNVAAVTGAGTYTNGQTAAFSAPAAVTNAPNIYTFRLFQANGSLAGSSPSFSKTFSTVDPTNLQYIAFYDARSILPVVVGFIPGFTNAVQGGFTIITNPVPASTNYQLTLQFDRTMDATVSPIITITNSSTAVQPVVPTNGVWFTTAISNDTYRTPFITFSNGMDGLAVMQVAGARDPQGLQMNATNVGALVIDVTPPPNPVLSLVASNSSAALVSWSGYSPPSDLASFRLYLSTSSFSSVAGLTPITSAGSGSRSFWFTGLALDQPYFAAVAAVDQAGNSSPLVTALAFTLPSAVPPPVPVQVTAVGAASALVAWNSYDPSQLLGFAGFQLYYATTNFVSVAGMVPMQTLPADTRSVQLDNLDRTKTYHFAVVGYNVNTAFNPNVTTAAWSDPYAGNLSANTTIGGSGQSVVDILQSITVVSNAMLTVPPGTTLRFAPGTGLTVRQGALFAAGTPLDPVIFTSANDQPGRTPAAGDWGGVTLGSGASASVLMNLFVKFGGGLTLDNCTPTVGAFSALNNLPAGLTAQNGAVLNTADALLTFNGVGVQQLGSAQLTITNSVIQNNNTNALALGGLNLHANADWWGGTTASNIDATLVGAVDSSGFLAGVPLLTPALGTSNNVAQVGTPSINLRLACRTADSMRLSEDSTFTAVFFNPFTNATPFALSSGGGLKTIFAQFRSVTGQTSPPISVTVNYITAGPTISSFNLAEGEVLSRPLLVTGSASAPLGMADLELYVDGAVQATNTGGSFSRWFDVRNFSVGTHRVELLARDNSGNIATLFANVVVSPTPPPTPVITTPVADEVVNTNAILVAGTAEPYIQIRLFNSALLVGVTNAAADGTFSFARVALTEGANLMVAQVQDALGSANSGVRTVNLDTTPPVPLVLNTPVYTPGRGLTLTWVFPATGKRAISFEVFWSTAPITDPSQALGHTLPLSDMTATVQSIPNGDYYFYVVGYDVLNNASPLSAPVTWHYDSVPPSFTVAFNKSSPVGVGLLHVILTASEALAGTPNMTVQPYGSTPSLLTLSNTAVNIYEADINVTTLLPSGPVQLTVSAQDLAGNPFNGAPSGPALVIDVTPPAGVITTAPLPPIQATNSTTVAVNLQLTKPPQGGTTPILDFAPPVGTPLAVTLTGSDTNWTGTLTLTPAMGSGNGYFTLAVTDALANVGHSINSGEALEIYNTAVPTPPGQPVHFQATSLAGGQIMLTWSNVPLAEIYRVYSDPGTNLDVPITLIADNLTTNLYVDTPVADGYYRYVVTASRRGAEGTNSIIRVVYSDSTPPPAPTNLVVQLAAAGMQITWQAGAGETPDHFNVYRNGTLIRTVSSVTPVIDNPPRGVMNYVVSSADALGNEAFSTPATVELFVGAVNNLQALLDSGGSPVLTWSSSDATAVGFNIYRNGLRQNSTLLASPTYADSFPVGTAPVTYAVTAVNSTNAESAARLVTVYAVNLGLLVNAAGSLTNNSPVTGYFDDYQVSVSNLTVGAALPLQQVELLRQSTGTSPFDLVLPVNSPVASGTAFNSDQPVPCSATTGTQSIRVQAMQQTDAEGSSVIYQQTFVPPAPQTPGVMLEVSANQLPLAGGLTPFNVHIYNRGYTPMYFVATRNSGAQPGDLYLSVKDSQGQEVSRTAFNALPSGIIFDGSTGYLMVPPGSSTTLMVTNVFTPAALASNTVTFQGVVSAIYDRVTPSGQQSSGPLVGSMQSTLSQTPYYGTAHTDFQLYSGDQPILISGQALDRVTGQPVPNVPLNLGFATRGFRWYSSITTDTNGNYAYTYNPAPGLAGTLTIWAAHPAVVDQLNQAQITIYRMYASPQSGDIRMSKNGTLPFSIQLLNPGDVPLTAFTTTFQAYQMVGTNEVPITTIHGTNLQASSFALTGGQQQVITLQLAADAAAPDHAVVVFTLTSAEGASATFTGNVTLLPAVPIVSVVDPGVGYVEVSLDRGGLLSRQVTIINSGLEDLKGVSIIPPTNVTWMVVNLPAATNGLIPLPDLPVGGSNSFTVVFTPPTNAVLGFAQDKLTIQGTNALAGFDVSLYALVTSSQAGALQFYVDDILGLDVPNATVRLRNTALQVELPVVQTDINGLVTVTNLQEGDWSWQVSAAGYSGNVGVTTVIADQTVQTHTRLNKSLVTVTFTVTPVPFSDKYDITIEQTFETHVPIPVLVMTPAYQSFTGVTPGFQATFIATAMNEGLVQMTDLSISGQQTGSATLTPLITYVPVLGPQQSIDIPMVVTYSGTNAPGQQGLGSAILGCVGFGNIGTLADFVAGMAAFAQAYAQCPKDAALIALATTVAVTMQIIEDAKSAAENLLSPVKLLGCILGNLIGPIGLPGIPVAIGTAPPTSSSVSQFEPIETGCFTGDTAVLLADGSTKAIDQIQAGDRVKSGVTPREIATVAQVYERWDNAAREVRFALPGQAQADRVRTTDEHLFWVDGKGWVAAAELKVGDWLLNARGQRAQILSNGRLPGGYAVYTLKLEGDTAFYANGILVHDLCGAWTAPARAGGSWTLPAPKPIRANGSQ